MIIYHTRLGPKYQSRNLAAGTAEYQSIFMFDRVAKFPEKDFRFLTDRGGC